MNREKVVEIGDKTRGSPIVGRGSDLGDLAVDAPLVGRTWEDLRDVREGGDGVDVMEDGGKVAANRLFGDVGDAGYVFADRGSP